MTLSAKQQWWGGCVLTLAVLLGGLVGTCATQDALDAETGAGELVEQE